VPLLYWRDSLAKPPDELSVIHKLMTKYFLGVMNSGDVERIQSHAKLILQFLKDNNIDATATAEPKLLELQSAVDEDLPDFMKDPQ